MAELCVDCRTQEHSEVCVPAVPTSHRCGSGSPRVQCHGLLGGCMSSMELEEPAWFSGSRHLGISTLRSTQHEPPSTLPGIYLTSSASLGKAGRIWGQKTSSNTHFCSAKEPIKCECSSTIHRTKYHHGLLRLLRAFENLPVSAQRQDKEHAEQIPLRRCRAAALASCLHSEADPSFPSISPLRIMRWETRRPRILKSGRHLKKNCPFPAL